MTVSNKYKIEKRYIDKGKARSGAKLVKGKATYIVSHETANNTADADDHFNYFNNHQPSASAHTFIDDVKILEIVPLDEKAWHNWYSNPEDNRMFGDDANDTAIGVELCRTGNFLKAYDKYVWYHAYLCKKFGLNPLKHIVAHSTLDPRRRSDPQSWLKPNGVTWEQFIKDVKHYYDTWEAKPVAAPKPVSKHVLTGGLGEEAVAEVSKYIKERKWWAELRYRGGENPQLLTGGLDPDSLKVFEAWLKAKKWYYRVYDKGKVPE